MTAVSADDRAGVPDLVELQRRTMRSLLSGQVLGSAGTTSAMTVGGLVVKDMLGGDTWAGVATAAVTMGSAFGSAHLARTMTRRGRRPGLTRGYQLGCTGAIVAVAGIQLGWLPLFLAGLFLYGHGQASNLLARYAAADLAPAAERARAISTLVFASTFGAVAGPGLVGVGKWMGRTLDINELAGPFVFGAAFFAVAAANTALRLRPDPLVVIGGVDPDGERRPIEIRAPLRLIAADGLARLAFASMVVSQVVMVGVMTMVPLHMKDHGHSIELVGLVLASHIAGMYAFAPLIGRASDHYGRVPMISVGAVVLMASCIVAALAGPVPSLLFASQFLLGVGWSFGLVTASALLSERIVPAERVRVQGVADLCMSASGGIAGFGSGFVKHALGFHMLANLGTIAGGLLLVTAFAHQRRTAPVASPNLPA